MPVEFNLGSNDSLKHIYDIREDWVQVYFKKDFLGRIMRTTSSSECQNTMFGNLTAPILSLVEFWVRFVHALESHWSRESKAENVSLISMPKLKTHMDIEKHGKVMYTHTNFYIFHNQLCDALFNCEILSISTVEGDTTYKIDDKRHQRYIYVVCNKESQDATCTCRIFQSEGIPCAHTLLLLKSLKEIPACFIGIKLAAKKPIFELDTIVPTGCAQVWQQSRMISNASSQLYKCMDLAGQDVDKL